MNHLTQNNPALPVARLCRLLDVPRSSLYYQAAATSSAEAQLREAISEIAGQWPTYGVRRITHQLRRDQASGEREREAAYVGQRRVHRLMREMSLCATPHKPRKKRTTNSEHSLARYPDLVKKLPAVERPEHVWASDITYVALGSGFVYLAVIMDVFTRSIRGWHLSRSLSGDLCLAALRQALASGRAPGIHHSDQGIQYAAGEYVNTLKVAGVAISMAKVGCPEDNGYAERLMRTIKEEHVTLTEYASFADAKAQISTFLTDVYNHKRIHSALEYLTPAEFEARSRQTVK